MSKDSIKNINKLSKEKIAFIDSIPYLSVYEHKGNSYYKFTGYHVVAKELKDIIPAGYKCTGTVQFWNEIKYTTINIARIVKE